ncbi:MAG TPA: ABC transporter permease, partial [Bacteroidia bacterium]|nr:ABC transporter permease [Bacteroidia bacterium]
TAIAQGLAFMPLALGIFLAMRVLNLPDITTDGSFTIGAAIVSWLLAQAWHPVLVLLMAGCCGALAGACTGLIHIKLRIHPMLAGIIVMTGLYSVNLMIMDKPNVPLIGMTGLFDFWSSSDVFLRKLLVLLIIAGVLIYFMDKFLKTDLGIAMRALGNNVNMLRANGVNTNRLTILGLAIANALTALSGALLAQYQGFADINMGIGIVIVGLAAVMLGESIFNFIGLNKMTLQLLAVLVGVVLFRLLIGFALTIGLNPNYIKAVTAIFILLFVGMAQLKSKPGSV